MWRRGRPGSRRRHVAFLDPEMQSDELKFELSYQEEHILQLNALPESTVQYGYVIYGSDRGTSPW